MTKAELEGGWNVDPDLYISKEEAEHELSKVRRELEYWKQKSKS